MVLARTAISGIGQSTDNGTIWSAPVLVDGDASFDSQPDIAQTSNGTLWVVWTSVRTGNSHIWYRTSSDGGMSWSAAAQLSTSTSDDYTPRSPRRRTTPYGWCGREITSCGTERHPTETPPGERADHRRQLLPLQSQPGGDGRWQTMAGLPDPTTKSGCGPAPTRAWPGRLRNSSPTSSAGTECRT